MARARGAPEVRIDCSLEKMAEFLDQIRTDDRFRAEFEASPRKVLDRYEISVSGLNLDAAKLPPKGTIPETPGQHELMAPWAWYRVFRAFRCGV